MDLEAEILLLLLQLGVLETPPHPHHDTEAIMNGISQVKADLHHLRLEMREDVAVLGDELAGFRLHCREQFARPRCCADPSHDPDSFGE